MSDTSNSGQGPDFGILWPPIHISSHVTFELATFNSTKCNIWAMCYHSFPISKNISVEGRCVYGMGKSHSRKHTPGLQGFADVQ